MKDCYVVATSKIWVPSIIERLNKSMDARFVHITKKEELNYKFLMELKPSYIFFPHWSYLIPKNIYENFECIIFHMTDVPFGRGGSPLQNLIERGILKTKISALKAVEELDAGDVFLKEELSLYGSAEEIYIRATHVVINMIKTLTKTKPSPVPQSGTVTEFKRRRPEDGNMANIDSLEKAYSYIRMLDAEGYPNAFVETEHLCFEFTRASLKTDGILADVRITIKNK